MEYALYALLVVLGLAAVGLNVLSLPGNWLLLAGAVGFSAYRGWSRPTLLVLGVMLGLLLVGEALEFAGGVLGAKKFGASRWAMFAALGGGLIGALVGSAFWLFGAIPGAIIGSFAGALLVELARKRGMGPSLWAAVGAAVGRTIGMLVKVVCGLIAWVLLVWFAWPG